MIVLTLMSLTVNVECQVKLNLKKKIESKVNQRVNQHTDQAIDKGMDAVEDGVKGDAKKTDKTDQANENQKNQDNKSAGAGNQATGDKVAGQEQATLQSYSKFDFIPGEKVIFFEDFSQANVGDFPALWNTNGSAEVMTTNLYPGKWLKLTGDNTCVWNDIPLNLPENYTIEFDAVPQKQEDGNTKYSFRLLASEKPNEFDYGSAPGKASFLVAFEYYTYYTAMYSDERGALRGNKDDDGLRQKLDQKYHISIWVQRERIRVYLNEVKVFDLPKALDKAVKYNKIRFEAGTPLISNVRVAVGAPDMRNKLLTEGKLVSYGIYFDVNKDVVKPESYGTLKEIAAVLTENPDVRVKIVGHTDSDGADAANLDLSKRRGASVKNELVKTFGIDATRLEADGLGESQPVAPNDTPVNKALNRRVEFIKL
jgi:outer membrane protein OmpA-like peptidoglycan-associated protein